MMKYFSLGKKLSTALFDALTIIPEAVATLQTIAYELNQIRIMLQDIYNINKYK